MVDNENWVCSGIMEWVFVLPVTCQNLHPDIRRWGLLRRLGHEGRAPMNGIQYTLIRCTPRVSAPFIMQAFRE